MRRLLFCVLVMMSSSGFAADYYVHASNGSDRNQGTSPEQAWKSLRALEKVTLQPGDRVLLARGERFRGNIELVDVAGTETKPIVISSYAEGADESQPKPIVDAKGRNAGVLILDSRYIEISNLQIEADGGSFPAHAKAIKRKLGKRNLKPRRVGVYVVALGRKESGYIRIDNVDVHDVYANNQGFVRSYKDTVSSNGEEEYGFGMFFASVPGAVLNHISVSNSSVSNVSHTGMKFHGKGEINYVQVLDNQVLNSGGPGMQMSGVTKALVRGNTVNGSGSPLDKRNWSRGSGMWTWGSSDIIVERNQFLNANGPGDSAGFHIDFNCKNIIVQYNLSANNAGGFIEVLGNNYNNTYRYNVSVNDGHRVKKPGVAFQEGKTFWLSGFVGSDKSGKKPRPKKRHGPYNTYIYNNTIFVDDHITAKIAVTKVAEGALIANNIFHIVGDSKVVQGDQYVPENNGDTLNLKNIVFKNNLFLKSDNWPEQVLIQDSAPLIGNAEFSQPGGLRIADYAPTNTVMVEDRGIDIPRIPGDENGLIVGLKVEKDILGNPIVGKPDMGAIEVSTH
ncbi:right-handed parallel beta-helix repeat-containing protein [Microbulbifer agarilyticus]|uniref:right-handed parallel beta-helix repeat-containing protein n=1 Tax=Microbulbifer agarilyticus TaxID=260552 RepID=UPI001CD578D5|nr:right-handed parallel beta-helix repeat-containing protein [Microbulbifer agarilyticus]MCA0892142.1 right-handed parallel beta-helix repeat-containing protein [Microbulbifer agarilyticus]